MCCEESYILYAYTKCLYDSYKVVTLSLAEHEDWKKTKTASLPLSKQVAA